MSFFLPFLPSSIFIWSLSTSFLPFILLSFPLPYHLSFLFSSLFLFHLVTLSFLSSFYLSSFSRLSCHVSALLSSSFVNLTSLSFFFPLPFLYSQPLLSLPSQLAILPSPVFFFPPPNRYSFFLSSFSHFYLFSLSFLPSFYLPLRLGYSSLLSANSSSFTSPPRVSTFTFLLSPPLSSSFSSLPFLSFSFTVPGFCSSLSLHVLCSTFFLSQLPSLYLS